LAAARGVGRASAMAVKDQPRYSMGGSVVVEGLAKVGFTGAPGVALVETQRPQRAAFQTVLAQNAWNFLPADKFGESLRRYPWRMQPRIVSRRMLARANVKRSSKVVCLSHYMAELVHKATSRGVEVSPVTVPLDVYDEHLPEPVPGLGNQRFAIIPGSITLYKRTDEGVRVIKEFDPTISHVLIAGNDDRSGMSQSVIGGASNAGLTFSMCSLSRAQLLWALRNCAVAILPSDFESLGFALSEALVLSSSVVASKIPAHVELSDRLGREPVWIDEPAQEGGARRSWTAAAGYTEQAARAEWFALATTLNSK